MLAVIKDLEDMFALLRHRGARRHCRGRRHVAGEASGLRQGGRPERRNRRGGGGKPPVPACPRYPIGKEKRKAMFQKGMRA